MENYIINIELIVVIIHSILMNIYKTQTKNYLNFLLIQIATSRERMIITTRQNNSSSIKSQITLFQNKILEV